MRLFIAIEVPAPVRSRLSGLDPGFAQLRWMTSFHLTLAFLGEVADPEPLKRELAGIAHPRFRLELGRLAIFGGRRGRPLGVWAEVGDPGGSLAELRDKVVAAIEAAGVPWKGGRFHPHVTLARGRRGLQRTELEGFLGSCCEERLGGFEVASFELRSSVLKPGGAEHRVEWSRGLDG